MGHVTYSSRAKHHEKTLNFKTVFFILSILILIPPMSCAEIKNGRNNQNNTLEELAVLVPSCDKYAEVWRPFFALLSKYWPTLQQDIYLIGNQNIYQDDHHTIKMIRIPKEKSWSDNMLLALDQIKENYILIILEDYFITEKVDHKKIQHYFQEMKKEKAAYLELMVAPTEKIHTKLPELGYISKEANYRTSLQVAIWDKKILKELLVSGENPWEFEIKGTIRSRNLNTPFMAMSQKPAVSYFGAIERGYWHTMAIDFLKKENIVVDYKLPISNKFRDWVRGPFRNCVSKYITQPIKDQFGFSYILPTEM